MIVTLSLIVLFVVIVVKNRHIETEEMLMSCPLTIYVEKKEEKTEDVK